jgi:hypothetical protein
MEPLVAITTWFNNNDGFATIICRLFWMNNGFRSKKYHSIPSFHVIESGWYLVH